MESHPGVLLLSPVAKSLFAIDIHHLVNTLFHAHLKKLHRDIRYPNLLKTEDGTVLINDWGSAVRSGTVPDTFSGAVAEGQSPNILQALRKGVVPLTIPNDDLYALALCITLYISLHQIGCLFILSPLIKIK